MSNMLDSSDPTDVILVIGQPKLYLLICLNLVELIRGPVFVGPIYDSIASEISEIF